MNKRPKVFLRYYSVNNLGDDLLASIVVSRYSNNFYSDIQIFGKYIRQLRNLYAVNTFRSNLIKKIEIKVLRKPLNWAKRLSRNTDLMVYVGGSIFMENVSLKAWLKEKKFYQNIQIPFYILGANFGPYEHKEFITIVDDILGYAKDICFRDHSSYKLFEKNKKVREACDVAFALDTTRFKVTNNKMAIISVIDCSNRLDKKSSKLYYELMSKICIKLMEDQYAVKLMSFCEYEGDEIAIQRILSLIPEKYSKKISTYYYKGDLEEALNLIACSEIIIGTRFHATVLGLVFRKKVLPIIYSDKTKDILDDMKFQGHSIDIRKLDTFNIDELDLKDLRIFNVDKQVKLAEKQFQELDKVLALRKNSDE